MLRLVSAVLRGSRGDAVLTHQGEIVWLLRKGGPAGAVVAQCGRVRSWVGIVLGGTG
jgi:hypothetical protein